MQWNSISEVTNLIFYIYIFLSFLYQFPVVTIHVVRTISMFINALATSNVSTKLIDETAQITVYKFWKKLRILEISRQKSVKNIVR
jgi:hypothetical protein